MKRFISILLSCMFIFTCSMSVFAGTGFDETVLNNAEGIVHTENTDTAVGWYTVESSPYHNSLKDVGGVQTKIQLKPYVAVSRKESWEKFNLYLYVDRKGDTSVKVDSICFRIMNSKEYTDHFFNNPQVNISGYSYTTKDGSKWLQDSFKIRLDKESFAMINDLIDNRDGTVEVWISLDSSTKFIHCADLGQDEIDGIIHLYNLYKAAGGLREDNLNLLESTGTSYQKAQPAKRQA